uniref:Putative secreted protein n=1 Tax=Corethrella appendiculata TaxID=1370023 RepID=U5EGF9_9DIPT
MLRFNSVNLEKYTFLIVLLVCLIGATTAISCYHCNSEFDPRCGDPFDEFGLGKVRCNDTPPLEHLPHLPAVICRKAMQKVYGKIRVVRGCGYITDESDDKECKKRSGTHDVHVTYCSCSKDFCNDGVQINLNSNLKYFLTVTTVLAIILQIRFSF